MAEKRKRIAPEIVAYVDEEHTELTLEVVVPGVQKEEIVLKIHEDSMSLRAPRGEFEYVTTMAFCCPVKPEAARAKYTNGLLKIKIPFKDHMEDAVIIKVE